MSKILKLHDGQSIYLTNKQADKMIDHINLNPNLRIIKVLTGTGFIGINPASISHIMASSGDSYRPDEDIEKDQMRALKNMRDKGEIQPGDAHYKVLESYIKQLGAGKAINEQS